MRQDTAMDILKTGGNVFLTGEPGAGKTYVINQYISWLEAAGLKVAVTASTGIAATHIGGMTIHSWSGIGARDELTDQEIEAITQKEKVSKKIRQANCLVIDEVSMLDGKIIDFLDRITKAVKNSSQPFGGLQVVFVGDFFQLPPINRNRQETFYAFESMAWHKAEPVICYLTEQFRQEDEMFLSLLQSLRRNEIEESHYTLLSEQTEIGYEEIEPTRLYTHNADVDSVNIKRLTSLPGQVHKFQMDGKGNRNYIEALKRTCLSPEILELKEEAMVMCTKNNFEAGYVNGTLGRVVSFDFEDGYPIIETADGREIKITPQSWSIKEDDKILAEITQVPLRLAWAITIHKSQGMSLDAAEIDLTRTFVYGQGYVALSRVRSLEGLKMIGMNPNALYVDPKIVIQDEKFRKLSDSAEKTFENLEKTELTDMHTRFVTAMGGRLPSDEDVKQTAKTSSFNRVKEESTYTKTKKLVEEKKSVSTIAKTRDLAESTIWTHLEYLADNEELTAGDIDYLLPREWEEMWPKMQKAMDELGTEKLKPIHEHLNEEYEYPEIRLSRIYYELLNKQG